MYADSIYFHNKSKIIVFLQHYRLIYINSIHYGKYSKKIHLFYQIKYKLHHIFNIIR